MRFDFQSFFEQYAIPYTTTGSNVKRGEVNIKCPFCLDDPSMHLGVRSDTGWWCCWRDGSHSGKSPVRLISRLIGCSLDKAAEVAGQGFGTTDLGELKSRLKRLDDEVVTTKLPAIGPPKGTLVLGPTSPAPFIHYLANRGFKPPLRFAHHYNLRIGVTGRWASRIVMPISRLGEVVGWVGRDITGGGRLRYLIEPAGSGIRDYLFNEDSARKGGRLLVVTEGPFDALKVEWAARGLGVAAVALLGLVWTEARLKALREVRPGFEARVVILDSGQLAKAVELASAIGAKIGVLPAGVADPGELTRRQVLSLVRSRLGARSL